MHSEVPAIRIDRRKVPRLTFHPGFAALYLLAGGIAFWHFFPALRHIRCPWMLLLAFPCPTCGGGRCITALLQGEILAALAFNPLVFLALVATCLCCLAGLVQLASGCRISLELSPALQAALRAGALISLLANHAYLIYHVA